MPFLCSRPGSAARRYCFGCYSSSSAFGHLGRSLERRVHTSSWLSSRHLTACVLASSAMGAAALTVASRQFRRVVDRHVNTCTHRFVVAVPTRGVAAGVRVASAIGAVAVTVTLMALALGSFGGLSIASLTHRYGSAVLTRGVAAGVRVGSAIVAVAATATLAVLPLGSFGVLGNTALTHRFGSAVPTRAAWLLAGVASASVAVAVTSASGGAAFG